MKKIFLALTAFFLTTPAVSSAAGLVICDQNCGFNDFVATVAHLINWGFYISLPIAVALFAYAGILYISGSEGNIKKGKGIFLKSMIGFIIMLVAFTCVHTVVGWLGNTTSSGQNQLPAQTVESLLTK